MPGATGLFFHVFNFLTMGSAERIAAGLLDHYAAGERDFSRANPSGDNLSGVNLSGVNLSGANLSRVRLIGAELRGANLYGAELTGAELKKKDQK